MPISEVAGASKEAVNHPSHYAAHYRREVIELTSHSAWRKWRPQRGNKSAAAWAISSSNGSWQSAAKAKAGVFVALGGAALTGGALAWANWLLDVGTAL